MKGKREIWFDFVDDFHQEVAFEIVADKARDHGYIFVYQNKFIDDCFDTDVKKLKRAINHGVEDSDEEIFN